MVTTRHFIRSPTATRFSWHILTTLWICTVGSSIQVEAQAQSWIIDDMNPAIRYEGPWRIGTECRSHCMAWPDENKALAGTWHVANWSNASRSFEYDFKGVEITIFGILVSARDVVLSGVLYSWNAILVLTIDGERVDSYHYFSSGEDSLVKYHYRSAVLKKSGLSDRNHTARVDLIPPSQFIFDYLTFTTSDNLSLEDDEPPLGPLPWFYTDTTASISRSRTISQTTSRSSSFSNRWGSTFGSSPPPSQSTSAIHGASSSNTSSQGFIIGAVVGVAMGFVFLLLSVLLFCFWRSRYRKKQKAYWESIAPVPYGEMNGSAHRAKQAKGGISNSTVQPPARELGEGAVRIYPTVSYPLHPRKAIVRARETGNGGGGEPIPANGNDRENVPNPGAL